MYELIYKGRLKYGQQWAEQYALFFFMFYDAGQAAAMANAETELDFWHMVNYGHEHFKRGTERRHFRGKKGYDAVMRLQQMGGPHQIWSLMHRYPYDYTSLREVISERFRGCEIGPYFTWKAMDILDRCLNMPTSCSLEEACLGMPDEPREAAKHFFPQLSLKEALMTVSETIQEMRAPGEPSRNCSYPEAETILCMMKGYFKTKTHKIGDDIDEKHEQLESAGHSYLRPLLPPQLIWSSYEQAMESARLSNDSVGVRAQE